MRTAFERSALGFAIGLYCAVPAARAAACYIVEIPPYTIDPSLRDVDTTPPTPFSDVTALAVRVAAQHCTAQSCNESSCGDWGGLRINFTPPRDDQTPLSELGYRLVWIGATQPDSMRDATQQTWPLGNAKELAIDIGFDTVAGLNGDVALIAVDRAGNESEASQPVHVEVLPCTTYFDQPKCDEERGCAVTESLGAAPRSATGWAMPLMAAGIWLGFWRRRRARRATARVSAAAS